MTNIEKLRVPLEQALIRLDRAMPHVRGLVNSEGMSELQSVRLNLVEALDMVNVRLVKLA